VFREKQNNTNKIAGFNKNKFQTKYVSVKHVSRKPKWEILMKHVQVKQTITFHH
jgi:hypothetical protein